MSLSHYVRRTYEIWKYAGWSSVKQKILARVFQQGYWGSYTPEALLYSTWMDFSEEDVIASRRLHEIYAGPMDIRSITWFLPDFTHPYYGGVYTLLRFAEYFQRVKGIDNHFAILGNIKEDEISRKIGEAFPALAGQPVRKFTLQSHVDGFERTDAAIATLWGTAYFMLKFNETCRKFYFIQDYEPLFYPAGSVSAQVEASYQFGYYGIANTPTLKEIYEKEYGGKAEYFVPCVDTTVFHPPAQKPSESSRPVRIFVYGRPGHPRNGFELAAQALRLLKKKLGDQIEIVSAGDRWYPGHYSLDGVVENLGLLSIEETAELYRSCDIGFVMMFTRHPSYLPFELMASGCLVVTNYNPATTWFLKDQENCLLSSASATTLMHTLEKAVLDKENRERITRNALQEIQSSYSDWDQQIEKIYAYMVDPEASRQPG
ncbi:MAG: glycosyltransferase family 4 protein [Chloroflexi bacterium]|jgi:glycosyltransferase involved in cell wall biosynthesis|nr:glycosyltransferase family 4 protein [Chloroflexota bacterium]